MTALSIVSIIVSCIGLAAAFWSITLSNRARRAYNRLADDLRERGEVVVVCPYITHGEDDIARCALIER